MAKKYTLVSYFAKEFSASTLRSVNLQIADLCCSWNKLSKSSAGGSRGGSGHSTVSPCSPSIWEQEGLLVGLESKLAQDVADPSKEEVYQEEE